MKNSKKKGERTFSSWWRAIQTWTLSMDCQKTKAAKDIPKYVATFTIFNRYSAIPSLLRFSFRNQFSFFFVKMGRESELLWKKYFSWAQTLGPSLFYIVQIFASPSFTLFLISSFFFFWQKKSLDSFLVGLFSIASLCFTCYQNTLNYCVCFYI